MLRTIPGGADQATQHAPRRAACVMQGLARPAQGIHAGHQGNPMPQLGFYVHSGRFSTSGLLLCLLLSSLIAAALAVPYGYAIRYIPLIYVKFLVTFGFGLAIGFGLNVGAKLGKVRNVPPGSASSSSPATSNTQLSTSRVPATGSAMRVPSV